MHSLDQSQEPINTGTEQIIVRRETQDPKKLQNTMPSSCPNNPSTPDRDRTNTSQERTPPPIPRPKAIANTSKFRYLLILPISLVRSWIDSTLNKSHLISPARVLGKENDEETRPTREVMIIPELLQIHHQSQITVQVGKKNPKRTRQPFN